MDPCLNRSRDDILHRYSEHLSEFFSTTILFGARESEFVIRILSLTFSS